MASDRHHQRACELAAAVMAELATRGLAPTPEHFRIWYVHLAGEDAALSRALHQVVQDGQPLDENRCTEIYERFFVRAAEERALLNAGKRLNELATELVGEVTGFGGETARFGSSLDAAKEQVSQAPTGERICSIVRGMVEETRRMQDQALRVESSLRANMAQIDGLRRDLQAAWSEARTDGLTGVANRRLFDQTLAAEWARGKRSGEPLSLLMLDVDHFKGYNDHYGHVKGDECLVRIAQAISKIPMRSSDLFVRYGGEEFALVLPQTPADAAQRVAEKCRDVVAALEIPHTLSPVGRITISVGICTIIPNECDTFTTLIERADDKLYRAKRNGRNCICSY